MNLKAQVKDNLSQILAITELHTKLKLRVKIEVIMSFITPIIAIFMPIIIMGRFFSYNEDFGPWNEANFMVFMLIVYNLSLLKNIIFTFPQQFSREKFWETLPGLIVAPINRINLLLGMFLAHLFVIIIPFSVFFIVCYIFFPISFTTVFFVILLFFMIALIFSGIGLILSVFGVSHENIYNLLVFGLTFVFWFSCISYPYQLYPDFIQFVINFNPLYYTFDVLRLSWIEDNVLYSLITHPFHFSILFGLGLGLPFLGVLVFNKVYKKYGIMGY